MSLKIARKTGQWWLGDMTSARAAKVPFDAEEYAEFLNDLGDFQGACHVPCRRRARQLFTSLMTICLTTMYWQDWASILSADGPPDPEKVQAKVQNPTPVAARLTNPRVAEEALNRWLKHT